MGDRIRMNELATDPGVFIRSMATRGSLGGLASATEDVLDLFECAGFERLIVETVGVGQAELDVARAVDSVLVVLVPESGDGIQTMKAGLMEIADIFVINKSDRDGADRLAGELESMLDLRKEPAWRPPVIKTAAIHDRGLEEVFAAAEKHRHFSNESGERRGHHAVRERILDIGRRLLEKEYPGGSRELEALVDRVQSRRLSPWDAARKLTGRSNKEDEQ